MDALPRELIAHVVSLTSPESHASGAKKKVPKRWRTEFKDSHENRQDIMLILFLDPDSSNFSMEVRHNHPVLRPHRTWNYTLRITDIRNDTGKPLPPSIRAFLNMKSDQEEFEFGHIERFIRLIEFCKEFHMEVFDFAGKFLLTERIVRRLPSVPLASLTMRNSDIQFESSFDDYLRRNGFKWNIPNLQQFELSGTNWCMAFYYTHGQVEALIEKFLERKHPLNLRRGSLLIPMKLPMGEDFDLIKEFIKESSTFPKRTIRHPRFPNDVIKLELLEDVTAIHFTLVKEMRSLFSRLFRKDRK